MSRSRVAILLGVVIAIAFAAPAVASKKAKFDVVTMVRRALHISERADRNARTALTSPVNSARIVDGNVTGADIADGAVTASKLGANSVSSANVIDGTIGPPDLADGGVTGSKLADGSVSTAKLADGSVADY